MKKILGLASTIIFATILFTACGSNSNNNSNNGNDNNANTPMYIGSYYIFPELLGDNDIPIAVVATLILYADGTGVLNSENGSNSNITYSVSGDTLTIISVINGQTQTSLYTFSDNYTKLTMGSNILVKI
jgi:hypothetical protein